MKASSKPAPAGGAEAAGSGAAAGGLGLPPLVLGRCFLRSVLLQASWNSSGMQNLGLLHAVEPALRYIYPEKDRREAALRRALEPFNSHPYMAAAVVGGVIHHEWAVAEGREQEGRVAEFKVALAGPLAGLGDSFFWASLRPAAAALGVLLTSLIGLWGVLVFLAAYNAVHLWMRARLFRAGLLLGDGVLEVLGELQLAGRAIRLKRLAAVLVALAGVSIVTASISIIGYPVAGAGTAVVLAGALSVPLVKLLRSPYLLLLAAAAVGVVLGLVGILGRT